MRKLLFSYLMGIRSGHRMGRTIIVAVAAMSTMSAVAVAVVATVATVAGGQT